MLPLKQYTIEDYYKFYRVVTPMIDKMVSESEDFRKHRTVRFEQHQLRDALRTDFQEESNLPPIAFRQFVDRMMEEMECKRLKPCEERTGVSWYEISAYLICGSLVREFMTALLSKRNRSARQEKMKKIRTTCTCFLAVAPTGCFMQA